MDLKLVKNLLDLISKSEVDEVSIEEGDFKIRIKKKADPGPADGPHYHYQIPPQSPDVPERRPQPEAPVSSPAQAVSDEDTVGEEDGEVVRSPIVGTFYRSPSPDTDAFVEIGDHIE